MLVNMDFNNGGNMGIDTNKIVDYTFTCTGTQQTFTVPNISKIRAVYGFISNYAESSYSGGCLDNNGNFVKYSTVNDYGVDAISGNTFDFHWTTTFTVKALIYGE